MPLGAAALTLNVSFISFSDRNKSFVASGISDNTHPDGAQTG